jgi:hypothetical protein
MGGQSVPDRTWYYTLKDNFSNSISMNHKIIGLDFKFIKAQIRALERVHLSISNSSAPKHDVAAAVHCSMDQLVNSLLDCFVCERGYLNHQDTKKHFYTTHSYSENALHMNNTRLNTQREDKNLY